MFREINVSKQAESGPKRRWYQSDYFDLYVFYIRHSERADKYADREFVGMQLCYDIRHNQRTLEWKKDDGFSHHAVSKGGGDTLSDHGASSALLRKGGIFDSAKVIDRFMQDSSTLPGLVKTFVLKRLAEYAKMSAPPPPTADELAAAAQIAAQVEAEAAAYAAEQEAVLAAKRSVAGGSIKAALAATPVTKPAPTAAPTVVPAAPPVAKAPPVAAQPAVAVKPAPSPARASPAPAVAAPRQVPSIEEFNLDDLLDKPS